MKREWDGKLFYFAICFAIRNILSSILKTKACENFRKIVAIFSDDIPHGFRFLSKKMRNFAKSFRNKKENFREILHFLRNFSFLGLSNVNNSHFSFKNGFMLYMHNTFMLFFYSLNKDKFRFKINLNRPKRVNK